MNNPRRPQHWQQYQGDVPRGGIPQARPDTPGRRPHQPNVQVPTERPLTCPPPIAAPVWPNQRITIPTMPGYQIILIPTHTQPLQNTPRPHPTTNPPWHEWSAPRPPIIPAPHQWRPSNQITHQSAYYQHPQAPQQFPTTQDRVHGNPFSQIRPQFYPAPECPTTPKHPPQQRQGPSFVHNPPAAQPSGVQRPYHHAWEPPTPPAPQWMDEGASQQHCPEQGGGTQRVHTRPEMFAPRVPLTRMSAESGGYKQIPPRCPTRPDSQFPPTSTRPPHIPPMPRICRELYTLSINKSNMNQ